MNRLLGLLALCTLVAGCGGSIVDGGLTATAPSSGHEQQHGQGPPAAYLTVNGTRTRMTTGSYCWTTMSEDGTGVGQCADAAGWAQIDDLPVITAADGDQVTLALGFDPTGPVQVTVGGHRMRFPAARSITFTPHGHGLIEVFTRANGGDVDYGASIR